MSRSTSECLTQTSTSITDSGPVTISLGLVSGSLQPMTTQNDVAAIGRSFVMGVMLRVPSPPLTCLSMSERLDAWMDKYMLAWSSNETDHIEELFTEDAVYDPQTADGEWDGRDEIVAMWQEIDDAEDNWDFEWQPIVETDDLAVIQGRTNYFDPPTSYRNLFIIRFADDGRCSDFTEWYIEEED